MSRTEEPTKKRSSDFQPGAHKKKSSAATPQVILSPLICKRLKLVDLQSAVLRVLLDSSGSKHLQISNPRAVSKVVILFVKGLRDQHLAIDSLNASQPVDLPEKESNQVPILRKIFKRAIPSTAPKTGTSLRSPYDFFSTILMTKKERTALRNKKISVHDLVLKYEDLVQNGFPIHLDMNPDQNPTGPWRDTLPFTHEGKGIFSLDCEMCYTRNGKVLTRISLINYTGDVVIDRLVNPQDEIIDYCTQYSGIDEDMLKDVKTTLQDVQQEFLRTVSSLDILIGHSLESDLNVLKVRHPNIIDTSIVFEHPSGLPIKYSLKRLADLYLKKKIQDRSNGHDSIEDAQTCLELIKLKVQQGEEFGKHFFTKSLFGSIYEQNRYGPKKSVIFSPGPGGSNTNPYCGAVHHAPTDKKVVEYMKSSVEGYDLLIGTLSELDEYAKVTYAKNPQELKNTENEKLHQLNILIEDLWQGLPIHTLFIINSYRGESKDFEEISEQRRKYRKSRKRNHVTSGSEKLDDWNLTDQSALKSLLEKAAKTLTFVTIKQN